MPAKKTLIIDNYDSFTWNLYQYVGELGGNPFVKRNDKITIREIEQANLSHIIISPGPGDPSDPAYFGVNLEVILNVAQKIPTLGVCLGHQGICYAFGGKVVRAPGGVVHGKTSEVVHTGEGIFKNVPSPMLAMRYHSLIGDAASIPDVLCVTATTKKDGLVMGVQHRTYPLFGIQFHPESIGTPDGKTILKNFLRY